MMSCTIVTVHDATKFILTTKQNGRHRRNDDGIELCEIWDPHFASSSMI